MVLRVRLTGVHVGEIVGVAPTRRTVNVEQIHFYEGRDGQLATHHYIRDDLACSTSLACGPTHLRSQAPNRPVIPRQPARSSPPWFGSRQVDQWLPQRATGPQ